MNIDPKQFKAAIFDFDGTVTEKGVAYPPQEMADALADLANVMPIAFCTGRQLESFEDHGLKVLLKEIEPGKQEKFLENFYLMAENGSIGYFFNTETDAFEEFYRAPWPNEFIDKEELKVRIAETVKDFGEIYYHAHRVVIVIRTKLDGDSDWKERIDEVYQLSDQIYEAIVALLESIDSGYEQYLHVGNSGIGVIVTPAKGDKDTGIREFASYLRSSGGIKFGPEARELLVVGDRPQKGGNDEFLLNGTYGTPFTVGNLVEGKDWPKPVLGKNGERLKHYEGTQFLIRKIV